MTAHYTCPLNTAVLLFIPLASLKTIKGYCSHYGQ